MKKIILYPLFFVWGIVIPAQTIYYVDAINGDDNFTGTENSPFKTIQQAANIMQSGDICQIKEGVYREEVVVPVNGVTFANYNSENVLITGLDIIQGSGFQTHEGSILKAAVSNKVTQVFVNGKRMNWARWPNEDGNMLTRDDMVRMDVDIVNGEGQLTIIPVSNATEYQETIKNCSGCAEERPAPGIEEPFPTAYFNKPIDYWAGAYVVDVAFNRNIFTANKGLISGSNGNVLTAEIDDVSLGWKNGNSIFLNDGGKGYIIGHLGLLDVEEEWHWENNQLYLYPSPGINVNTAYIEVRQRKYGFNLTGRDGITLKGLNFKAAAIQMNNTTNCLVDDCTSRFGSSFSTFFLNEWGDYSNGDAAIHISGSNNTVKNSYIGYTWGHGISLWADNSLLENNFIEQCNWIGERMSPIFAPGNDNTIIKNTIRDAGREGIELGNQAWINKFARRATVKYNHIYDCGYLCPDSGSIYVNAQGYNVNKVSDTDISYNIIHDFKHPWLSAFGGIYLDNGSSGFKVHHNILWNVKGGVKANASNMSDSRTTRQVEIYHNTVVNSVMPVRFNYNYDPDTKPFPEPSSEIIVKNNQGDDARKGERRLSKLETDFGGTELVNNRGDGDLPTSISPRLDLSEFVDAANRNYNLKPISPSIDAGVVIPGINDTGDGAAVGLPDIGALEFGGVDWTSKVGTTISVPEFSNDIQLLTLTSGFLNNTIEAIIYPNPTGQILNINLKGALNNQNNIVMSLYSIEGKEIMSINQTGNLRDGKVKLDVSNLSKGVYILKIEGRATNGLSYKVIIK